MHERSRPPYWLMAALLLGFVAVIMIFNSTLYREVFQTVLKGLGITLMVTAVAYVLACLLGLFIALGLLSKNVVISESARFYVEIIRGIPVLVLLFYLAFALTPLVVAGINLVIAPLVAQGVLDELKTRDIPLLWRAVLALIIAYSPFIAEIFRAGLLAVDKGQIEAAKALGLNPWHRFIDIIFPQALKVVIPPLGNDLVAMVKDSSLVSVLGVADLTQMGKLYASGSFRYFETYNIVAFLYLTITLSLSLLMRSIERRLRGPDEQGSTSPHRHKGR